jgi:hypothetical protein
LQLDPEHELARTGSIAASLAARDLSGYRAYLNPEQPLDSLLITGVWVSPADAKRLKKQGYADPFGRPYTKIWASSPDGSRVLDILRAIVIYLGLPVHGSIDLGGPYEQIDLHSQGVDAGINLLSLGVIKAKKIHIYAPPGGASGVYPWSEKLQKAIDGADEVDIYCNAGDPIIHINVAGMSPQVGPVGENAVGLRVGIAVGPGGPRINKWVFHTEPGRDHTEYHVGFQVHHIFSAPRADHTREDYWFNVLAAGRRRHPSMSSKRFRPVYWAAEGEGVDSLAQRGWVILKESERWRLVGPNRTSPLDYIGVLITSPEDSPEDVAEMLQKRNQVEYPGRKALILLEGSAGSARNAQIIAELEKRGYSRSDINIISNGDRYSADGALLEHGAILLSDTQRADKVLALGIWGYELSQRLGRPVIADPLLGKSQSEPRASAAADSQPIEVSRRERGNDALEVAAERRRVKRPPRIDDLLGGPLGEDPPPASSSGPPFEPPPPPVGAAQRPADVLPATEDRGGVYTVDDRNLSLVPAAQAGTGFIFGEAETAGRKHVQTVRVPYLLFPHNL